MKIPRLTCRMGVNMWEARITTKKMVKASMAMDATEKSSIFIRMSEG